MKLGLTRSSVPGLLLAFAFVFGLIVAATPPAEAAAPRSARDRYLVVLKPDAGDPKAVATELGRRHGLGVRHVYRRALLGFSARIPAAAVGAVERDPRVDYVSVDRPIRLTEQTLPTGVDRVDADQNTTAAIDQEDAPRVDVDVAILDSGIDAAHPDLNYAGGTDCMGGTSPTTDENGHGTHVAGIVGALDNTAGVVGVAPGARLWSVKITGADGTGDESNLICGIEWVTANAATIEVANVSAAADGGDDNDCGSANNDPIHFAICRSVGAGVTYAVGAGNRRQDGTGGDAAAYVPAAYDEVITVSALVDSDGLPGGAGEPIQEDPDDSLAYFSAGGPDVDLAAPGVAILSTLPQNAQGKKSGTSMAAPHVAGAAALHIATHGQDSPATVRRALLAAAEPGPIPGDNDGAAEGIVNVADRAPGPDPTGPDLVATALAVQGSATAGQVIYYRLAIKNQGAGAPAGSTFGWGEYFSADARLDAGDEYLGGTGGLGVMRAGGRYSTAAFARTPEQPQGRVYLLFEIDHGHQVTEADETNNVIAVPIRLASAKPDLVPQAIDAPNVIVPTEFSRITQTVRNAGSGAAVGTWYDLLYLSTNETYDASDVRLLESYYYEATEGWPKDEVSVQPGQTYERSHTYRVPDYDLSRVPDGPYFLVSKADDQVFALPEENDNNNVFDGAGRAVPVTVSRTAKPDLLPVDLAAPSSAAAGGDPIELSYTLRNAGISTAAAPWRDQFVLSPDAELDFANGQLADGDRALDDVVWDAPAIEEGTTKTKTVTVSIPTDVVPRDYYLIVRSDVGRHVAELNEDNNAFVGTTPITIGPRPTKADLLIESVPNPSAPFEAGSTVGLSYGVRNRGDADATAPWRDRISLRGPGGVDGGELSVAWDSPTIAPGAFAQKTVNFKISSNAPAGEYVLTFEVDLDNQVAEWDNNNNRATTVIQVVAPEMAVTCKASSSAPKDPGADACDGKLTTAWVSKTDDKPPTSASITFTLAGGERREIGEIRMWFERVTPNTEMAIQASNNGTKWRDIAPMGAVTPRKDAAGQPVYTDETAAYIRFQFKSTSQKVAQVGYLREVEFAPPSAATARTVAVTSVDADETDAARREDPTGTPSESDATGEAAPTVTLTSPKAGQTLSGEANLAAKATGRGIDRVLFQARPARGGRWVGLGDDPSAPYARRVGLDRLRPGDYELRAVAVDDAGKETASAPVAVTIASVDDEPARDGEGAGEGRAPRSQEPAAKPAADEADRDQRPEAAEANRFDRPGTGQAGSGREDGGGAGANPSPRPADHRSGNGPVEGAKGPAAKAA